MPKTCPKCGSENVIQAAQCTSCAATLGGKSTPWCGILLALFLGYAVVHWVFFGGQEESARNDREISARIACENAVRSQLVAPSTAKFNTTTVTEAETVYGFRGTVDAQNSFGASLRTTWTCVAERGTGDRWRAQATVLE